MACSRRRKDDDTLSRFGKSSADTNTSLRRKQAGESSASCLDHRRDQSRRAHRLGAAEPRPGVAHLRIEAIPPGVVSVEETGLFNLRGLGVGLITIEGGGVGFIFMGLSGIFVCS
jgi:hypothetical protein